MISLEEQKNICKEYDLGEPISFEEIGEGTLNRNYLLQTTRGRYFIKAVREKMKDKLASVFAVESYMKSQGIPAVAMLTTTAGKIFVAAGAELCTLYPFVESDRSHSYAANDYKRMGKLLGKIHRAGSAELPEALHRVKQFGRPEDEVILERLRGYKDEILKKVVQDETDKLFLHYIDFKLRTAPKLKGVESKNDTLIHGDYHPGNLLMDKDSREVIGVCDWEKAEFAPRSYELARSLFYTCFEGYQDLQTMLGYSKALYEGYLRVYPMDKSEIMQGLTMRIHRMALSSWIEETYYRRNDDRANKFIEHEMNLIDMAVNNGLLGKMGDLLKT